MIAAPIRCTPGSMGEHNTKGRMKGPESLISSFRGNLDFSRPEVIQYHEGEQWGRIMWTQEVTRRRRERVGFDSNEKAAFSKLLRPQYRLVIQVLRLLLLDKRTVHYNATFPVRPLPVKREQIQYLENTEKTLPVPTSSNERDGRKASVPRQLRDGSLQTRESVKSTMTTLCDDPSTLASRVIPDTTSPSAC
ncbi:uncharacterized protein K444DRAFT_636306 [Hyaloscypha bicolor E]|uniref:Uncharacterized protein n=1 Tax=Hyaloscypha bicolor E TaxID=1095630 RepID=A0A2J6SNY8_9HELO|nr:uncharacterized protein K444DRAFT_636306 [Hyaloscypha bicolor E]PMD52453.1 hypothetical protein K444DRAFT_636306 [Hyaloscypha bicolor E]